MLKVSKFIILCISLFFIAGCSKVERDKDQLLEVSKPNGEIIRQTTNNKIITELIRSEEIEKWEEVKDIPMESEVLYIFTSYEAITDPIFLENDEKFDISIGKMKLFKNNENYYIEDSVEFAQTYVQIPSSAGEYLEKFGTHKSKIEDKYNLFASWEEKAQGTGKEKRKAEIIKVMKDRIVSWEERLQDSDIEKHTEKTVKTERIKINNNESGTSYFTTDTEEIVEIYNNLQEEKWQKVDKIPLLQKEMFIITFSQHQRRTLNKKLTENSKISIYKVDDEYWAINSIPSNELDSDEIETFYKVPETSIKYLNELVQ